MARRLLVALVAVVLLVVALPASAAAHAALQHSTPHGSSTLQRAPSSVRLDFNEPVEASFGAVRVYDARGARVDTGKLGYAAGQRSVTVGVRDGLGRGIYTATYRVVSADGHPVSGGFAFGVGLQVRAGSATPEVAELLARTGAGVGVEGLYGLARGLHYATLLLLIGAIVFRLLVWPARSPARWPARTLLSAAVVGLLASLAGIALQGALGAGVPLTDALNGAILSGSLDTRTGYAWLLRAIVWAAVIIYLAIFRSFTSHWHAVGLVAPVGLLVASLPYAGHADTQSPQVVLIPADALHVLAAGAWLGGLVLLLVCFWPRRSSALAEGAAEATARFSRLALPAIVVLLVAGTVQAWFYLGSIGALLEHTYGWALIAKIVFVAAVGVLAAGNRRRTSQLTRKPDAATALRRSIRGEVLLAALVLAATATLVRAAPPATIENGPVVRALDLGPLRLQLDIEPATSGANDLHLYLFDRRTGRQIDRVEALAVTLTQREKNIGPIRLDIPRKGPAHYELLHTAIGVAGEWTATITARVSDFDQHSVTTSFVIRP